MKIFIWIYKVAITYSGYGDHKYLDMTKWSITYMLILNKLMWCKDHHIYADSKYHGISERSITYTCMKIPNIVVWPNDPLHIHVWWFQTNWCDERIIRYMLIQTFGHDQNYPIHLCWTKTPWYIQKLKTDIRMLIPDKSVKSK